MTREHAPIVVRRVRVCVEVDDPDRARMADLRDRGRVQLRRHDVGQPHVEPRPHVAVAEREVALAELVVEEPAEVAEELAGELLLGGHRAVGSEPRPVYNAAVQPLFDQTGIACIGGQGVGYYPNPVAYGDSAATIESGGQFILDRGYPGCFGYIGE